MQKYFIYIIIFFLIVSVNAQENILQEEQDYRFSMQLYNQGMYDIAAVQFLQFADNFPYNLYAPQALLNAAISYEKMDSLGKASQTYLDLLMKFPQSSLIDQGMFNRAAILFKFKDFVNAALYFERLRLFVPNSNLIPQAEINASESYFAAGKYDQSIDAARFVIENFPTHPLNFQARYLLAKAYAEKKDINLALNTLNGISGKNTQDIFLQADMLKASLYEKAGRYSLSDSILYRVVQDGKSSALSGKAAIQLALNLQNVTDYSASLKVCSEFMTSKPADSSLSRLAIIAGDNHYLLSQFTDALSLYEKSDKRLLPVNWQYALEFRKGLVKIKLGRADDAIVHFSEIINDTLCTNVFILQKSLIHFANLSAISGHPLEAVRTVQDKLQQPVYNSFADEILYELGKIQFEYLKDTSGARSSFASVYMTKPNSRFADEAQYQTARTFEISGQLSLALAEFQRYIKLYPGGDDYKNAQNKISYLLKNIPADPASVNSAFSSLMNNNTFGENSVVFLANFGKNQAIVFHNYPLAIQTISKALTSDSNENLPVQELTYYLVVSHAAIAEKFLYEKNQEMASAHIDTLNQLVDFIKSTNANSAWAIKADFEGIQINLLNQSSFAAKRSLLDNRINSFSSDPENDSLKNILNWQLAQNILSSQKDTTDWLSIQKVGLICNTILTNKKYNTDLYSDVLLINARALHQLAETDSSIQLLNKLIRADNNSTIVQSKLLLAQIYNEKKDFNKSTLIYNDLMIKYPYSSLVNQAKSRYAEILLKNGRTQEAQILIDSELPKTAPELKPVVSDFSTDEKFMWLAAQIKRYNDSPMTALTAFRDYIYSSPTPQNKALALLAMGELASQLNNRQVAVGHFNELAKEFPNDSLAQIAKIKSADLYFDDGMYNEALELYKKIKDELTNDNQVYAAAREIICEYKLGNLAKANGMAQQYSKKYNNKNWEAQFLYEEGQYYIAQKEFVDAEKAFKNLAKKYDDTPTGAHGELGLARMYVITGKPEEALKILTKIPEDYKDPEILAIAYINLADFYYENRLLSQCITACEKVLEYQPKGMLRRQALNMMIRSFDEFRLKDKAIALLRQYIDEYPDDPDILSRRIQIGIFLYDLKDYERCISHLKMLKPLVDAEEEPEVQYWIAKAYSDKGETEQAIVEFLKVKLLSKPTKLPWGVTALYEAGLNYKKLGNYNKALDLLKQVLRERGATDNIGRAANERIQEIELEMGTNAVNG